MQSELKEMTERNQSLQRELNLQRKSFNLSQDRSKDVIEGLISENSHLTKTLGLAEKERDDLSLEMKELQAQYEENIEKLDQVSQCVCLWLIYVHKFTKYYWNLLSFYVYVLQCLCVVEIQAIT